MENQRSKIVRRTLVGCIILLGLVAMATGPGLMNARAATGDVTVSWVIPTDLTITISYPTGEVDVRFDPTSGTFPQFPAKSQGASGSPAAFRVTNSGNVAVKLDAAFISTFPTGVAEFRIANTASGGNPGTGQKVWCGSTSDTGQTPAGICSGTGNETVSQTLILSLAVAGTHDRWAWAWGTGVGGGTVSRTFRVTSTAA